MAGSEPDSVAVEQALLEEFERVGPHWLPPGPRSLASCFARMHALPPDQRPTALCLSGGGIRSATFGLGVLQSLARSGRLRAFDYLSTVSGGGYIGSWLTAWLRREGGHWDRVLPSLADGVQPLQQEARRVTGCADAAQDPIGRLRAYSNFLSPVWGLSTDSLSLVAIFLRNLLLNLLVWLPLLAALVALPRVYIAVLALQPGEIWTWAAAVVAVLLLGGGIAYTVADLPAPRTNQDGKPRLRPPRNHFVVGCFLPLLLAAMLFSIAGAWDATLRERPAWAFAVGGIVVHLLGIAVGVAWRLYWRGLPPRDGARGALAAVLVLLIGAVGGVLLWLALQNPVRSEARDGVDPLSYATASVPVLLGCYWVALSLYAGMMRRQTGEDEREWWSRATGSWLLASLAWLGLFGLTVQLPLWLFDRFGSTLPDGLQLGLGGTLLGIVTALAGYWSKNGATLKRRAGTLLKATGMRLLDLMAGLVIVTLVLVLSLAAGSVVEQCHGGWPRLCQRDLAPEAAHFREQALLQATPAAATGQRSPQAQAFEHVLVQADVRGLLAGVATLVLLAVLVSWAIGANAFSLHGMYGNRLVRAYLGATRFRRRPHWFTGFDPDDNLPLDDRPTDERPTLPIRPLHVVNIALNLVRPSDRRLAWQQRKAASFTATPLRCGAEGLGYVRSQHYGGPHGMTLGRALTISGAAASPNMGYHSSGLVTLVMALFNVRLGWWLPNPGADWSARWAEDEPRVAFWALLNEALGRTTDDQASVYLSDGGHFENLGLYEMVRRRCHRVVVVDATCDPKFAYADLLESVRKIRVDLGIPIDLPATLPGPGRDTPHERLLVGRIRYSARDGIAPEEDGWLYLIKPRLVGDEPPQLAHYAANGGGGDSPFPHQSTADQFFDEMQFESYRLLGLISAEACFPAGPPGAPLNWPRTAPPRRRRPPLSAAASEAEREASAPLVPAGSGGLLDGLQQLGTGTALAAALTVGGTLGVVGTVSLAPTELRLSAEDRALLKEGLNIRVDGGPAIDTEALRALAEPARQALRSLESAGERLQAAADRIPAQGRADPALARALGELGQAIAALSRRFEQPLTVRSDPGLTSMNNQISSLVEKLDKLVPQDNTALKSEIEGVTKALRQLKESVDSSNPRRNARGQEVTGR